MRKYRIVFMLYLIKHVAFSFKIITMENRGSGNNSFKRISDQISIFIFYAIRRNKVCSLICRICRAGPHLENLPYPAVNL